MAVDFPYMVSNNKIGPILERSRSASKPTKFTHQFLKHIGFSSSNDRAIIPLLKKLGFITEDGTPTSDYDRLRDNTDYQYVLAENIKELYSELYTINTNIHQASDNEIKGAFSRITGKDETSVNRLFLTFKALCNLADFSSNRTSLSLPLAQNEVLPEQQVKESSSPQHETIHKPSSQFHYNIQIHLPPTTDISVYNAIFKSLKDNLLL